MFPIRIKACSESDLRMLGDLARNVQRVLPVTQADIDAAAALGEGWVVWKVIEVNDPIDNLRGGTQLVIKQNSITPGQNVRRVLIVSGPGGQTVVIGPDQSPLLLPDAVANSLQYVKAFGGTEQRNLPDNYLQRQFIYMMDGSYLLTDLVPTYDGRIEMDFQTTSVPSGAVYLLGGRTVAYGGMLFVQDATGVCIVDAFGTVTGNRYTSSASLSDNTRYKFTFNNKVATLKSGITTLFTNTFTGENANGAALCINGLNSNGTVSGTQTGIYLYSFKMWNEQGELVADYVPAVQKGTVPVVGFYDTVSGTFKTATAGTFAAGGEAVPTPDTPMDIVCNNGVIKCSSNLWKSENVLIGYIESAIGERDFVPNDNARTLYIPIQPNTTYTVSKSGSNRFRVGFSNSVTVPFTVNTVYTGAEDEGRKTYTVTNTNYQYLLVGVAYQDNIPADFMAEQGYTATTYHPYGEIYTDGTVETLNIHGKNLFDYQGVTIEEGKAIGADGSISNNSAVNLCASYIPVSPNTTYTFSGDVLGGSSVFFRVAQYKTDETFISRSEDSTGTRSSYTFTTGADTYYIRFHYIITADINTYQLEQGSQATPYEPYFNGGTATAEMLLKVGDYQDVQSIIDGVVTRKIGIKVLDGTENWQNISGYFNLSKTDFGSNSTVMPSNSHNIICSHFETKDGTFTDGVGIGGSYVNFKYDSITTVLADWKTWLAAQYNAGTPVIIVYPLATPTTESVAGQTLQVQAGDNTLEITQASLSGLELEAEYEKEG